MSEPSFTVACTLTEAELASRISEFLPGLLSKADLKETIPGGFRWRFHKTKGLFTEVVSVIEAERECCRFLKFGLTLEPDGGPLLMEITGPEGTQAFLQSLLAGLLPSPSNVDSEKQRD